MAGPAPGAPLLTVGDLLRDLSYRPAAAPAAADPEEPDSPNTIKQKKIAQLRSLFYSTGALSQAKAAISSTGPSSVIILTRSEDLSLVDAFEEIYVDLTTALSENGSEWTGLSEQLCTTFSTANQLISTARKETGPLLEKVRSLQALVQQGRVALAKLQTSIAQSSSL